jgi:hypothetical protein
MKRSDVKAVTDRRPRAALEKLTSQAGRPALTGLRV